LSQAGTMTTADQLAIVNKLLQAPEEAHALAQAGLLVDWVKSKRLLVLVRCGREEALFVLNCRAFPVLRLQDLALDTVVPLDHGFRFDLDSGQSSGPDAVSVTVTNRRQKFLFELLPGYHTQNFVAELYRLTEGQDGQEGQEGQGGQSATEAWPWLQKYTAVGAAEGGGAVRELREGTQGADMVDAVPRSEAATGAATPMVGRDRESVVIHQMTTKEDQFTELEDFTLFVGTWNVNGQSPEGSLAAWLSKDPTPPDLYAIGFQELDLSKEAFVFLESVKEEEWMKAVAGGLHPGAEYSLVRHVRLVGMLLLVYCRKELQEHVTNVAVDTVGTGIMGKLGNKGGVSCRLRLHATDLCFVNSHLAAHVEEFERRNQDYSDICSRMAFSSFERPCSDSMPLYGAKRIKDHDMVFWLGDLNYRLSDLDCQEVKELLLEGSIEALQLQDQFVIQRQQRKVFVGYKEGAITFPPTYKYDPGTSNWDSSEKSRPPAWTDRVLWRGEGTVQVVYRSHMDLLVSDHKPVSAVFRTGIKVIDRPKRQKIKEDIMKRLDMLENDFLPQVMVDKTDVIYEEVRFIEPVREVVAIANTGQVPVSFEFIKKPGEASYARPWLQAEPSSGFIMPGEKADVALEVFVDKRTAGGLNSGQDKLYDILVLHLMGGKDIFITVSGTYIRSCFGSSLAALVQLTVPLRELTPGQVASLEAGEAGKLPAATTGGGEPYPVPKELWFLCDIMTSAGLNQENLFLQPGLRSEILWLRDWLDTGLPLDTPKVSIHSAAETLLIFLESLREPIIPYSLFHKCLECSSNYLQCKQLISHLPATHRHVFDYLTAFLREVVSHSARNGIDPKILATLFCNLFLRDPPGTSYGLGLRAKTAQQLVDRRKTAFVHHFIVNQPDD